MDAQAVSNATAKNGLAGHPGASRHETSRGLRQLDGFAHRPDVLRRA